MTHAPNVTLSILTARTDVRFMLETIPHLVRMCNHPFAEKVLVVDTAPIRDLYRSRPGIGTKEDLEWSCGRLVDQGVIDRVARIDYSPEFRSLAYRKHFGREIGHTHDCYGYPILGSVFPFEDCRTQYLLHFDCDMLLHQAPGHSWIDDGVRVLRSNSDVLFVSPLPAPPHPDGLLKRQESYERDPRGFYRLKTFTSRKFLLDRDRFASCLPIRPRYLSLRGRIERFRTKTSALRPWETMISAFLKSSRFIRADLDSPNAWTLHTPDHGSRFVEHLPGFIPLIEAGEYPAEQAGDYDQLLEPWVALVQRRASEG